MQLVGVCLSVALALGQVLSALPALAQARTDVWERIEARRLDARAEVVSLPVGRREGRYTAVRLSVPADPVFVREMSVVLASGEVRVVGLRRWLGGGEQTEALSVAGGIAEIRLIVRGEAASPANPIVELLGEVASTHLARPRPSALAQGVPPGWVSLGLKRLASADGHEPIRIGREKGHFDRLAVRASDGRLVLSAVRVIQANREAREFHLGRDLEPGARTPELPVDPESPILDVVLILGRGSQAQSSVEVIGRYADGYAGGEGQVMSRNAGWLLLGTQSVGRVREDRDEYVLDPGLGRIAKLRFTARHGGASVREVTLTYWNGRSEQVTVNKTLQRDETSAAVELKRAQDSDDASIRSIIVQRRSGKGPRSDAVIEVWGQY